jgi:hydroxymethylpyrimidine/phosphomethylpyrimidine kinase
MEGDAIDVLFAEGEFHEYSSPRIATRHTHGTGCTYSAAIAANLALGYSVWESVGRAKRFIEKAIATAPGLGKGAGPVNHHAPVEVTA